MRTRGSTGAFSNSFGDTDFLLFAPNNSCPSEPASGPEEGNMSLPRIVSFAPWTRMGQLLSGRAVSCGREALLVHSATHSLTQALVVCVRESGIGLGCRESNFILSRIVVIAL